MCGLALVPSITDGLWSGLESCCRQADGLGSWCHQSDGLGSCCRQFDGLFLAKALSRLLVRRSSFPTVGTQSSVPSRCEFPLAVFCRQLAHVFSASSQVVELQPELLQLGTEKQLVHVNDRHISESAVEKIALLADEMSHCGQCKCTFVGCTGVVLLLCSGTSCPAQNLELSSQLKFSGSRGWKVRGSQRLGDDLVQVGNGIGDVAKRPVTPVALPLSHARGRILLDF